MVKLQNLMQRFRDDESGASLVEYGLLVGLIAVVAVGAITLLGEQIDTIFTTITEQLEGVGEGEDS